MLIYKNINKAALLIMTMSLSSMVLACKPNAEVYDLAYFLNSNKEIAVAFKGKVVAVKNTPKKNGSTAQEVTFSIEHWWKGGHEKTAIVYGSYDNDKGSSCAGVFDFHADEGQEWLIIGTLISEKIQTSPSLSVQLNNGQIPSDLLKILQKKFKDK